MNKDIKKDFLDCKNKDFIHYLIYLELKGKDINKSFSSSPKGFNKMMDKIFNVLNILKEKEKNMNYIKKPFPKVSKKKLLDAINSVDYKLKNT